MKPQAGRKPGTHNSAKARSSRASGCLSHLDVALCVITNIFLGVVDNEQKLQEFLPTLRNASWVAVDTEADSLHAYPEKVCLIQISTVEGDQLIDPLAEM